MTTATATIALPRPRRRTDSLTKRVAGFFHHNRNEDPINKINHQLQAMREVGQYATFASVVSREDFCRRHGHTAGLATMSAPGMMVWGSIR